MPLPVEPLVYTPAEFEHLVADENPLRRGRLRTLPPWVLALRVEPFSASSPSPIDWNSSPMRWRRR